MTDQPSQRAMKLAQDVWIEDFSHHPAMHHEYCTLEELARKADAAFPAYLEIREALQFALECRHSAIDGLCRTCRTMAEAALAKARKD